MIKSENLVTCLSPKIIHNKYTGQLMSVPCGKCSACLSKKAHLWTSRLQEESTCHTYTLFGTLTYHDDFLTKINPYTLDDVFYTDSFVKCLDSSSHYIKSCNNEIPCLNVRDIQNFFKRLRSYINYYLGYETKIRYFVVGEYGSSTFRPHWHYIIWFDSSKLAKVIKSYIFKSWKSFTHFTTEKKFFGRNKTRFVSGYVEKYVAGYVNKSVNLPEILNQKPFRQFHLQSSNPPIGTIRFFKQSLQRLLFGDFDKITLHKRSTGDAADIPYWRGLENRLFPKCIGFADIDYYSKLKLYGLYSECRAELASKGQFEVTFKSFSEWFLSEWQKTGYGFQLFTSLLSKELNRETYFKQSLQRLFNISKRICEVCDSLKCEKSFYVKAIERYYKRKEYNSLVVQLSFEEKLSSSKRKDTDIRYYPFIVDALFYNNLRGLKNYENYLYQFNLIDYDPIYFVPEFSVAYQQKKAVSDFFCFEISKKRLNKEFISDHPECYQNYKSLLRPCLLTL